MMFERVKFDVPCTIKVEHTNEHFHAHVELDGDIIMQPGDQVRVHGAPIRVLFGERMVERRTATIARANVFERAWARIKSQVELTELYEITFSSAPGAGR
jgi:hypothetical protein